MGRFLTKTIWSGLVFGMLVGTVVAQDLLPSPTPAKSGPNPRDYFKVQTRRNPTPTAPPAEVKGPVDKFFSTLKLGDTTKAYEELLINTRLAERKENLKLFIEKTDQALGLYGKVINYEIYDNYNVGSGLMVLTYLSLHPVQPLRWRFVYYRPEKAWMLIDVRVDDVLEDLLD